MPLKSNRVTVTADDVAYARSKTKLRSIPKPGTYEPIPKDKSRRWRNTKTGEVVSGRSIRSVSSGSSIERIAKIRKSIPKPERPKKQYQKGFKNGSRWYEYTIREDYPRNYTQLIMSFHPRARRFAFGAKVISSGDLSINVITSKTFDKSVTETQKSYDKALEEFLSTITLYKVGIDSSFIRVML